jgi:membrane-associated phospholipid phosphatase
VSHSRRNTDLMLTGYNLVLALVWMRHLGAAWYVPWFACAHLAAATLPLLLDRLEQALPRVGNPLRELYALISLLPFWTELGHLQALNTGPTFDAVVARLDLALFGQHLNLVWMPAMPQVAFSELMHFCYFAYYPLIFLPPLAMYLAGRTDAVRDMTFRLMVTYLACYLLYLVFPVIGPAELLPHYDGALKHGLFYGLTHAARAAGDSLGTAFPSSHAAGVTASAVLAWRWFRRPVAIALTIQAAAVLLATVYTQNHYAVDTLAGFVWALSLQLVLPELGGSFAPFLPPLPALSQARAPAGLPSRSAHADVRRPEVLRPEPAAEAAP